MIPQEEWLQRAKGIPIGTTTKVIHGFNCRSKREAMSLYNDGETWSCYCFSCRDYGKVFKSAPSIVKVPKKTGYIPNDLKPLLSGVMENPSAFREVMERHRILYLHITSLQYSKETGRLYFPDVTQSFLGMDYTGKANALFYSPQRRKVAGRTTTPDVVTFTGWWDKYLESTQSAMLVMDFDGFSHALAKVFELLPDARIEIGPGLTDKMKRELKPFT